MPPSRRRPTDAQQVVGIVLGVIAVFVPGTLEWQAPGTASTSTLLSIATVGGALGGGILVPWGERARVHVAALVCGALAAAGAFALLRWWVEGRASVMAAEVLFVTFLGSVPGALLGLAAYGRLRRRDDPMPPAKVMRDRAAP